MQGVELSFEKGPNAEEPGSVHEPVLLREIVDLFKAAPEELQSGWIVDATLGAGGHTQALLREFGDVSVLGVDQDPDILSLASQRLASFGERVRIRRGRMSRLGQLVKLEGLPKPVGMLCDLGASSLQLDRAERGFSFQVDGPLDMRMDPERTRTAAEILNTWDRSDLADLFYYEGGEPGARRVADAVVEARRHSPLLRTAVLASLIERTLGRRGKLHPATRVFQALRRAVNEEGEELLTALRLAECLLADGGLLAVVSFHSGEDACVKRFLSSRAKEGRWKVLTKSPVKAQRDEILKNRRSRSALLRGARRTRTPVATDRPARSKDSKRKENRR